MDDNAACEQTSAASLLPHGPFPLVWDVEPRFVTFFIPMLVPFAIPEGATFSVWLDESVDWLRGTTHKVTPDADPITPPDGNLFVTLAVWRPREELQIPIAPIQAALEIAESMVRQPASAEVLNELNAWVHGNETESYATVIEATTPLVIESGTDGDDALEIALARCLHEIATFTRAYLVTSNDVRVRAMTRRNAYPLATFATRFPESFERWDGIGLITLNDGRAISPAATSKAQHVSLELLRQMWIRLRHVDPLIPFAEQALGARRSFLIDGDYWATVVSAYTAGEMLLNTILLLLAWEEGVPRAEARAWFENDGLKKRLRTRYHERLGGNWNSQGERAPLASWEALSALRGRAVHIGYRPTEEEAEGALTTYRDVLDFIYDRVATKSADYPKTALLLLGRFNLIERRLYTGIVQRLNETENHAQWLVDYQAWFDTPVASRNSFPTHEVAQPAYCGKKRI